MLYFLCVIERYLFSTEMFISAISTLYSESSFSIRLSCAFVEINCANNCGSLPGLWSVSLTHLSTLKLFYVLLAGFICSSFGGYLFLFVGLIFRVYFISQTGYQCPYIKQEKQEFLCMTVVKNKQSNTRFKSVL